MLSKSYWLRGGIILSALDAILILFIITTSHPRDATFMGLVLTQPLPFPSWFINQNSILLLIVGGLLGYFVVGAIIGAFVGWIKRKLISR